MKGPTRQPKGKRLYLYCTLLSFPLPATTRISLSSPSLSPRPALSSTASHRRASTPRTLRLRNDPQRWRTLVPGFRLFLPRSRPGQESFPRYRRNVATRTPPSFPCFSSSLPRPNRATGSICFCSSSPSLTSYFADFAPTSRFLFVVIGRFCFVFVLLVPY